MFTEIYLTMAIVLHCYKKCSNFLWYFNDDSPVFSLFSKQKLSVFVSVVPFQLIKIASYLLFLNASFPVAWKYFREAFSICNIYVAFLVLLTILSILNITAFSLISVLRSSYKRLTSECSFY